MEKWFNMEIYESFSLKGHVEFDYMTTAKEEEKHLTTEEISILLLCKYDKITSPEMRISPEGFETLSTRR